MGKKADVAYINFKTRQNKESGEDFNVASITPELLQEIVNLDEGYGVQLFLNDNPNHGKPMKRKDGTVVKDDDGKVLKDTSLFKCSVKAQTEPPKGKGKTNGKGGNFGAKKPKKNQEEDDE